MSASNNIVWLNNSTRIQWEEPSLSDKLATAMPLFVSMLSRTVITLRDHKTGLVIIRGIVDSIEAEDGSGRSFNLVIQDIDNKGKDTKLYYRSM